MDPLQKLVLVEIGRLASESPDGLVREPVLREERAIARARTMLANLLSALADAGLVAMEEYGFIRITQAGIDALNRRAAASGMRPRVR